MSAYIEKSWCMVTIMRPNGKKETIRHPQISTMTASLWEEFCRQMAKAGRGTPIAYENKSRALREPANEKEMREICDHQDRMEEVMRTQG